VEVDAAELTTVRSTAAEAGKAGAKKGTLQVLLTSITIQSAVPPADLAHEAGTSCSTT